MGVEYLNDFLKSYKKVKEDIEIEDYDKAIPKMEDLKDELEMLMNKSIGKEYGTQMVSLFVSSNSLCNVLKRKDTGAINRTAEKFEIYFKQLNMRLEVIANNP